MRLLYTGLLVVVLFFAPARDATAELGLAYGRELRGNTELEQYELSWRQALSWGEQRTASLPRWLAVESGFALLRDSGRDEPPTARLSLMPQLLLAPRPGWQLLAGLGTGLMAGDTNFAGNNLGGRFFLASKLGIRLQLTRHLAAEYLYYHQSNAGIYDHNAGLNMHQLALVFRF